MLNQHSLKHSVKAKFGEHFTRPLYDTYSFAKITGTIELLLTGATSKTTLPQDTFNPQKNHQSVLLLFIDSFGWEFWNKYHQKYPFLQRFLDKGIVSRLTSLFPSTTAAHVTNIHTGLMPAESGVFEWYYYEPSIDDIFSPLLYSVGRDKKRDSLGFPTDELLPSTTFYQALKKKGFNSYIIQHRDYTPSIYSDTVFAGATEILPYRSLGHALTLLTNAINKNPNPAYYLFYYDSLDGAGHVDGPHSQTREAEIEILFNALEHLLYQQLAKPEGLCILLTADHGLASTPLENTFYINKEIPELVPLIRKNSKNQLIVPGGSCRDFFLYLKNSKLNEAKLLLESKLNGIAEVFEIDTLIKEGFFGKMDTNSILRPKLGDLLIAPYNYHSVWWYEEGVYEQVLKGHHGGLTPEEMEIPFLCLS